MDRPLDATFVRWRTRRRALVVLAIVSVASGVFAWGPELIRPTVKRSRIRTARVEPGTVESVITASGTVLPEVEQVLSSPVDARVLRILERPGTEVKKGDPIVELDLSQATLAVAKLDQDLALKRNQQARTRLDLESKLIGLESQRKVKSLSLQSLETQLERKQQLHDEGLVSDEELQQARLGAAQAAIEREEKQDEAANARESTKAQIEGLDMEIATLRKERSEAARQLSLGTARADRSGVVTWTVTEEGASIHKGDVIARLADLRTFRVDATVSDVHARRLVAGLPVAVRVGDDTLEGVVSTVLPTIQNGAMTFVVALKEKSSPVLRSNLRVDVLVVTGRKERTLRVKKGPGLDGDGEQRVFVVRGDRAVRTRVRIGLTGFDACEVAEGLREGDEVVLSEMTEYMHLAEVRIR